MECSLCYVAVLHRVTPNPVLYNSCNIHKMSMYMYNVIYNVHQIKVYCIFIWNFLFILTKAFLKLLTYLKRLEDHQTSMKAHDVKITKYTQVHNLIKLGTQLSRLSTKKDFFSLEQVVKCIKVHDTCCILCKYMYHNGRNIYYCVTP